MDIEQKLKKELFRALCPDSALLGEYYLKLLTPEQAKDIKSHIQECPHCREDLKVLSSYLSDLESDVSANVTDKIKVWIGRLIPPPGPGLIPAYGIRGQEGVDMLRFAVGEGPEQGELILEIQDDPENPGHHTILGLLTGIPYANLTANLSQDNQDVSTGLVDEFGNLILTNLTPGSYDLKLTGETVEILIMDLKVS